MNIVITGDKGSGKSTLAVNLSKVLDMVVVDDSALTVDELMELGSKTDNTIFVHKLAWYAIPNSYKVHLMCNPVLAAQRTYKSIEGTWEDKYFENDCTAARECASLSEEYGFKDPTGYDAADLVVHVGYNSASAVCRIVNQCFKRRVNGNLCDPKIIIPVSFNKQKWEKEQLVDKPLCNDCALRYYRGSIICTRNYEKILPHIHRGTSFINVFPFTEIDKLPACLTEEECEDLTGIPMLDVFDTLRITSICEPVYANGHLAWGTFYEKLSEDEVYAFMQAVKRNLGTRRKGFDLVPQEEFDNLVNYNYTLLLNAENVTVKGAFDCFDESRLWLMYENSSGLHQCYFNIDLSKF